MKHYAEPLLAALPDGAERHDEIRSILPALERFEDVDPALLSPTPDEASATADLLELMLVEPHIPAESLAAISCPATVMVGEYDCIRDDETVAIWRSIPGARLSVVPECGHSIPKRRPDMVVYERLRLIEA